jgi:hypothetical protein
MARAYFRAAIDRTMEEGATRTAAFAEALLADSLVIAIIRLIKGVGREAIRAHYQLAPLFAPVRTALVRRLSPIRPVEMRHWLTILLAADGLLWVGLLGLFGFAAAEGSESPLITTRASLRPALPNALAAGVLPTHVPTTAPGPTATPLPLPTATPIPLAFSVWQPRLPAEAGWDGAGACSGEFFAPTGTGYFAWPTTNHFLSGYDYSWWHLGLDISSPMSDPISAADSGLVSYAGWNAWGYGNLVIIDHGNGWHTLYAHLSQVNVTCGQAVEQGAIIGLTGSTGHSTGPHLHFEMRFEGEGRVNPWLYLP